MEGSTDRPRKAARRFSTVHSDFQVDWLDSDSRFNLIAAIDERDIQEVLYWLGVIFGERLGLDIPTVDNRSEWISSLKFLIDANLFPDLKLLHYQLRDLDRGVVGDELKPAAIRGGLAGLYELELRSLAVKAAEALHAQLNNWEAWRQDIEACGLPESTFRDWQKSRVEEPLSSSYLSLEIPIPWGREPKDALCLIMAIVNETSRGKRTRRGS